MSDGRDPLQALAVRWGAAAYLVVILGTEILTMLVGYLAWQPNGSAAVLQLVVYIVGVATGVLLWRQCTPRPPATGLLRVFLALVLGLWFLAAARQVAAGDAVSPLWLTVPLLLAMTWRKPPSAAEARSVVTGVASAFAAAVVIAVVSEVLGLSRSWYVVMDFEGYREWDAAYYWLPLADLLGLDGRWAGPFLHPNIAGPIGGLLIVVGLCRRGYLQGGLLLVGFLVLLLTSSRTSMVGALAGVIAVVVATALWDRQQPWRQWLVMTATVGAAFMALVWSVAGVNEVGVGQAPVGVTEQVSSAMGRSDVWSAYVTMWWESPWWGSPDERIGLAALSGDLPSWASTAHNLLLDSLVRFGVLGTVLVVTALVVAGVMAVRAAAVRLRVGLGLVAVVVGGSLTEALISWRLLSISWIVLFLAVIASAGPYPPARWPGRGSKAPERTTSTAD